jgi:serine/threonine-protein kinase
VKGKIAYMSPEQVQGRAMDARTDIFAAGIVLWEALTGRRLFLAADAEGTASALLKSRIVPPSEIVPNLPRGLDRVVLRALERDPERRFQTGRDFAEALRRAAEEGSRREVADWVGRVASDGLAQRLELIEALEASALHTPSGLERTTSSARRSPVARAAPMRDSTPTRVTSITSVVPEPKRKRRWPAASWWIVAAALLSVTVAAVAHLEGPRYAPFAAPLAPSPAATATPTAKPSANVPPPLADAPPPPAVSSSAPAPLLVESLPLVPNATPPLAGRVKRKRRAARPSAVSAPSAPAPPASAQATTDPCAAPYRIDEAGVRWIRPECL